MEAAVADRDVVLPTKIDAFKKAVDLLSKSLKKANVTHSEWSQRNANMRMILARDYDDATAIVQQVTDVLQTTNTTGLVAQSRLFSTVSNRSGFKSGQGIDLAECDPRDSLVSLVHQLHHHVTKRIATQREYDRNVTAAMNAYVAGVQSQIAVQKKMIRYYESQLQVTEALVTLAQEAIDSSTVMANELNARIIALRLFSEDSAQVYAKRDLTVMKTVQARDSVMSVMRLTQTKIAVEYV